MALVKPSPRSSADATRRVERAHAAVAVALDRRPGPPAPNVGEGTRRERVRMELLLDRAGLGSRERQPPMCDISTLGRSTGVPCVRSSE